MLLFFSAYASPITYFIFLELLEQILIKQSNVRGVAEKQ